MRKYIRPELEVIEFDVDDLMSNTAGAMIGYYLVGKLDFLLPDLEIFDGNLGRRKPEIVKQYN